jgi:hypothetical protein
MKSCASIAGSLARNDRNSTTATGGTKIRHRRTAGQEEQVMGAPFLARAGLHCAVVVAFLALVGCGGGGGGSGGSTPPPVSGPPPAPPPPPPPPPPPVAIAPTITGQTLFATVIEGQSVTFTVFASGDEPLTYQWRRDGASLAGAVASTYTISSAALSDSGAVFSVVVSNVAGQAESSDMPLTVNALVAPVEITTEPVPQHLWVGDKAVYSVVAHGSPPLTYQWRRDGVAIPGATDTSYEIAAVELTDSEALFDVVVTNAAGSVASRQEWLIVDPLPPSAVDAASASFLVALGYAARQTGEQRRPGATASAPIMLVPDLPLLDPRSRDRGVPSAYQATFAADNFDHSQFLSPISAPATPISLWRHDSGTLAGVDLDRYRGLAVRSALLPLAMDVIIGTRSGFAEVGIGNWKFIAGEQFGFFAGFPTAHGTFIVGEPTADAAVAAIESGQYSGFTHGGLEFELLSQNSFWEFSGKAAAAYDAATGELTLTLQDLDLHGSSMSADFPTTWPTAMEDDITILTSISLGCTAVVDPATNAFSCALAEPGGALAGSFNGRFYGQDGQELAGTFSIIGLIRFSFDDGMVGAVALKR